MKTRSRVVTRGFTLLELIIVVGIIGALALLGIPTFRKLVTRARRGEAKLFLGNLFRMEQGFHAEFSCYTNNLRETGYQTYGNVSQMRYRVGFRDGAGNWTAPPIGPSAVSGSDFYNQIILMHPNYNNITFDGAFNTSNGFGRATLLKSQLGSSRNVTTTYDAYTAAAEGVILGGIDLDNPASETQLDVWQMDQTGSLGLVQDGS